MKTLRLDFIKCIIPKSWTFKHFLALLSDEYLATKIPDMSGENLTDGNPIIHPTIQIGFVFVLKMFQDKCNRDCNRDYFQCNRNRLHCDFVRSLS